MKWIMFVLFSYMLAISAFAGPDDKWVYIGSTTFDGIALLLAVGAFSWVYLIYRDFRGKRR